MATGPLPLPYGSALGPTVESGLCPPAAAAAAAGLSVERTYAFLRHCFGDQHYHVASCDEDSCDPEFDLWDYF